VTEKVVRTGPCSVLVVRATPIGPSGLDAPSDP